MFLTQPKYKLPQRNVYTTEQLIDSLADPFKGLEDIIFSATNTSFPPYNIILNADNSYTIELAIAGFKKEEIVIELNDKTLMISGKKEKTEDKDIKYLSHGIAYRDFVRTFSLSAGVKVESATHSDGLLKIELRYQSPEKKSNLIPIS